MNGPIPQSGLVPKAARILFPSATLLLPALLPALLLALLLVTVGLFRGSAAKPLPVTNRTAGANLPADVDRVFRRACKDCHSNETEWPWYANLPPLSLAIKADVTRGRSLFNMSEWTTYSNGRKRGFLAAIQVDVARKNMPPQTYRWMHSDSQLTPHDEMVLRTWAKQESLRLRGRNL